MWPLGPGAGAGPGGTGASGPRWGRPRACSATRSRRWMAATIASGWRAVARASRYTPAKVASAKRSSAVRWRRTSRLWRSTQVLLAAPPLAVALDALLHLGRFALVARVDHVLGVVDERLDLGGQLGGAGAGVVEPAGHRPQGRGPHREPLVGGEEPGPLEVAGRRGGDRRGPRRRRCPRPPAARSRPAAAPDRGRCAPSGWRSSPARAARPRRGSRRTSTAAAPRRT